jgi:hypothetical protein
MSLLNGALVVGFRFYKYASPTGFTENSPAIYGWDLLPAIFPSPVWDERNFLSSLAGLFHWVDALPSLERLGYYRGVPQRRQARHICRTQNQNEFQPRRGGGAAALEFTL